MYYLPIENFSISVFQFLIMSKFDKKKWIIIFVSNTLFLLTVIALFVVIYDPFFHYHKPLTNVFYYSLENERYQNDGITKNFDYTGIITGTSMSQNFSKTEADKIFNEIFIKVPYAGSTFKEITDNLLRGVRYNKNIRIVIREIFYSAFTQDPDKMRTEEYPYYLYDDRVENDIKYFYNFDVVKYCFKSLYKTLICKQRGIQNNFDSYNNWMGWGFEFGRDSVLGERKKYNIATQSNYYSEPSSDVYKVVDENIDKHFLSVAVSNPNIQFYYFFTPFSVAWWGHVAENGSIHNTILIEKYVIEKLINQPNINLYSFNNFYNITTDLNNYKDMFHYGEWINSDILIYMKTGLGKLTKDNYKQYLDDEENFYINFDYNSLFD